jgi:hypothetical protein
VGKYNPTAIDPSQDAAIKAAFPTMGSNSDMAKAASVTKLITDGLAGVGTVSIGGMDYHGEGRDSQAAKDQNVGAAIGGFLAACAAKGTDGYCVLITDGSVVSDNTPVNSSISGGRYSFVADSGNRSSTAAFVYKKDGPPPMVDNTHQSGAFVDNNAQVDTSNNAISNNTTNLCTAYVANYMALTGNVANLAAVVGTDNLTPSGIAKYVKFAKLR